MTSKTQIGPLALLSAAALALPAFSASQPTERVVSVNTSVYQEGDANAAEVVFGQSGAIGRCPWGTTMKP